MIFLLAKYFHILSVLGLIGGLTMEVLLMALIGGVFTGRAFARGEKILNSKNSDAFSEAKLTIEGFDVKASLRMRLLLLPAILALMVFQPRLEISIILVFVCLGLGLLSAFSSRQYPLHFKPSRG